MEYIIIGWIVLIFLSLPLGAVINSHKIKVRRRQRIQDMAEAYRIAAKKD